MRLSTRGWNNVLIFASLFMIVLFNTTHQKLIVGDDDIEKQTLVPEQAIIQVVDYSGIKLERIGADWRVQSSLSIQQQINPNELVNNWQNMTFEVLSAEPELSAQAYSLPVLVQAIGLESQLVFVIYVEPESGLVYFHNKINDLWQLGSVSELMLIVPPKLLREVE